MITTIALWWLHLKTPSLLFNHHEPIRELVYIFVLTPPFLTVVTLGYLFFSEIDEKSVTVSGPMSGYLQGEKAGKRWKIIVTAGAMSVTNLLLMLATSRPASTAGL